MLYKYHDQVKDRKYTRKAEHNMTYIDFGKFDKNDS